MINSLCSSKISFADFIHRNRIIEAEFPSWSKVSTYKHKLMSTFELTYLHKLRSVKPSLADIDKCILCHEISQANSSWKVYKLSWIIFRRHLLERIIQNWFISVQETPNHFSINQFNFRECLFMFISMRFTQRKSENQI